MATVDPRVTLAYQMAVDQLARQFSALDELRGRVGVVLSGAAIATGFLAGQALNTAHGLPWQAIVALTMAGLLIASCTVILWPRKWDGLEQHADQVLKGTTLQPNFDEERLYTDMAGFAVTAANANTQRLKCLYAIFAACLVFLVLDFGGWVWTLVINQ